jgi:hypothetical protein
MIGTPTRRRRVAIGAVAVTALALVVAIVSRAPRAAALSGSQFQAGNIISDSQFYDSTTMNAAAVQTFLNAELPSCQSGYICLPQFSTATTNQPSQAGLCNGYTASTRQSAATIIVNVALSCGINPQVLIVMLQKEQGLVTDSAPQQSQYDFAMGANCPDTTGCSSATKGFFIQVYTAAYQFKYYRMHSDWYSYAPGRYNSILYNPNTACGSSQVYIQNWATALLYIYTPYQPNAAALANLYGSGDACSAYGNRNFWRDFTTWFGQPSRPYDLGGLLATKPDGSLWWYGSSGSLAAPYSTNTEIGLGGWQNFTSLLAGDVDGDGLPDAVARTSDGALWLYTNTGTTLPYQRRVKIGLGGWNIFDRMYLGDVNNDGFADLVATTPDGRLWLYLNHPHAAEPFAGRVQIGTGWDRYAQLVLGDVDGDGRADMTAIGSDGSLTEYHDTGNVAAPFTWGRRLTSPGWNTFDRLVAADLDGDGRADLVASRPDGTLWAFPATGVAAAPFAAPLQIGRSGWDGYDRIIAATAPVPRHAVSADLITTDSAGRLYDAANNTPPNPFPAPSRVSTYAWSQFDVVDLGNFVGGAGADAFVRRSRDGAAYLFPYTGQPGAPYGRAGYIGSGWQTYDRIVAGDFTGDGRTDLIARRPDGTLWLYQNTGAKTATGLFRPRIQIGLGGWQQFDKLFAGDADGDGRTDLLVTKPSGALYLYSNTGNPDLPVTTRVGIGEGFQFYDDVAAVAGGKGMPVDLIARRSSDGSLWFFRNTGDPDAPYASYEGRSAGGWGGYAPIAAGDVNGDGRTDLVGVDATGLWLSRGRAPGPFAAPRVIGASGWQNFDKLTSGDVDGDGRADLVLTKPTDGTLWYYRNDGSATPYRNGVKIGLGGWQYFVTMAAGDVTGDGRADLVLTRSDGSLWLYVNNGTGTPFSGRVAIGSGFGAFERLMLADVNGDGLADLLAVKSDGSLWLAYDQHDPAAPFGALTRVSPGAPGPFTAYAAGDVNHDGYADLVATTADGTMWYFQNTGRGGAPFAHGITIQATGWDAYDRFAL